MVEAWGEPSGAAPAGRTGFRPPQGWTWPGLVFAACAAFGCVFAFVGLGAPSYWTDELFSLFVIHHSGGFPEVLRRALTDTHPPLYYFLLYAWSKLVGLSETAMRAPSAVFAVGAVIAVYAGTRRSFSPSARAFACAIAVTSQFWFDQSQNVRSYALSMAVSASLLLIARHVREHAQLKRTTPWLSWAGLTLLGFVGGFTHFYTFLQVGLIYLFLILTVRLNGLRAGLIVSGLAIAGLNAVYIKALMRSTQQNTHQMWFHNDALFLLNQWTVTYVYLMGFAGVVALVWLAIAASRQPKPLPTPEVREANWTAGLCLFAHLGMVVTGSVVSVLIAPSLSSQNLGTASPLLWTMLAWLYDRATPETPTRASRWLGGYLLLTIGLNMIVQVGRLLPRNEDFRASAAYVASFPACADQTIPVVFPERFGPVTPFFRTLAEQSMFGWYYPHPEHLKAYRASELTDPTQVPGLAAMIAARAHQPGGCPVLAWGVHDMEQSTAETLRDGMARLPGVGQGAVKLHTFVQYPHGYDNFPHGILNYIRRPGAWVFVTASAPAYPPSTP